eukprot:TRINITY_DN1807_c0_g1::TRINITY_DN1807_c0_g1_i1::g.14054::m.14054 TRINITY_DN1807_c0_g1::TRINITY_DN1807_c0_g1_i1::g.14054  ORF type:complete len:533 (+),score=217.04,sp/Q9S7U0/INO1_WHEAT/65.75/0.0,NAD_binding_5/PF07994.7/1e-114,Inos-1-P_synth/PF01658.12/4.3e-46 TRINITY_DN1807_c0_g1_i1:84-1682(+)
MAPQTNNKSKTGPLFADRFTTVSPNVKYDNEYITSEYDYLTTEVQQNADGSVNAVPKSTHYTFRTKSTVPKTGLMLVGWGGNNGSTVTAGILANRMGVSWMTKRGEQQPDYFGSLTQAATTRLGVTAEGRDVYVPFNALLPMIHPNDFVLGGWDISSMNLADAMNRAGVLDYELQRKLAPHMKDMKPLPGIYYPDFIAANQSDRCDNVLPGTKQEHLEKIRKDIRDFKEKNGLDQIVVLWTANTERFADLMPTINDTADNLLAAIKRNEAEISPSTIYAIAAILEHVPYVNGSPQNTFVPGVVELACRENVLIAGDDFKSGQTKFKSVMVDFLVSSGLKPTSIVSYNHLGNNDGKNLNAPQQFRSKEISKSNVVDDMVASNNILYAPGEHPDHCVVIKYIPEVGDSKRAMDEYTSRIFLGGYNTISIHNVCEDSLLAAPIIMDLAIIAEICSRIQYKTAPLEDFQNFHPVASLLSFLCKAPLVPSGTPIVNALFRQRAMLENVFRACVGLSPENNMALEHKYSPAHLAKLQK